MARQGFAGARALLVDDNRDALTIVSRLLGRQGVDVKTADNGEDALLIADAFRPELLFIDISMPTLSGHEVLRQIRAQPWSIQSACVAMTGWGRKEDRISLEAEFDAVLIKPVSCEDLDRIVDETLGHQRFVKEHQLDNFESVLS